MATVEQILNIDLPKPTFALQPSRLAPLPSDMPFGKSGTGTGRNTAGRTLDPVSGKYVSKGADVPRIYGADQSLLVEAVGRTNHVLNAFDLSEWVPDSNIVVNSTSKPSIVEGENAAYLEDNGRIKTPAGTFSTSIETASFFIEKEDSDPSTEVLLIVRNSANFNVVVKGTFDTTVGVGSELLTTNGQRINSRKITDNGRNGGVVWQVVISYDPTLSSNGGASRDVSIFPDGTASANDVYFHGAQLEEAPNASSPIVTQGSPVTRAPDKYVISLGDWWNTDEGTIFAEFVPQYQNVTSSFGIDDLIRKDGSTSAGWLQLVGSNPFDVKSNSFTGSALKLPNESTSFESVKAAISVNRSGSYVLSVNGVSKSDITDGSKLLGQQGDILKLASQNEYIGTYLQILYYPRALSESTLNAITA